MELVQLHTMEPLSEALVASTLAEALPPSLLEPRGGLSVRLHGPWRPADLWPDGIERLTWTATFEATRGRFLREEAIPTLVRRGLARTDHPVHAAEALGQRLSAALLVVWSDAQQLASCAVWRERRLTWSVLLEGAHGGREEEASDGPTVDEGPDHYSSDSGDLHGEAPSSRLIRSDGRTLTVESPVVWVPEGDRTGVLLAAFAQFWREPLALDVAEQITLPDTLEALTIRCPALELARDGRWLPLPSRRPAGVLLAAR